MSKTVTISPVTRVEGHGKVTLLLNDKNEVERSHFHVVEFRGFEKFCEGRLMSEMPVVTTRICGICPVSHHLAAAKACDDAFGVDIPPAAKKLRELMHMGQMIHSHAFHFLFMASPDYIVGPSANPENRNITGVVDKDLVLAKKAIRLRQIGQNLIDRVGGRPIHPVTAIPGGMSKPLSYEDRHHSLKEIEEAVGLIQYALKTLKKIHEQYRDLIPQLGDIKTHYMGLVKKGKLEFYDGTLRIIDEKGKTFNEFDPKHYLRYIGEHVEDWSYLKFPYYKPLDYPKGIYRVGPLARLNAADGIATEQADIEFQLFKALGKGQPVHEGVYFHYARLIEILYAVERARELLADDEIVSREVRVKVDRREGEGIGVIEAPRGTLIHHYWADRRGKLLKANLIVATVQNNPAIDMSVNQVAKNFVHDGKIAEGALNHVEMAIRCYDPCLSCATHAVGEMPLRIEMITHDGKTIEPQAGG